MTRRARLDAELVRRGLARSREHAAELVAAGQVRVPGRTSVKAATQVDRRRRRSWSRSPPGSPTSPAAATSSPARWTCSRPTGWSVAGRRALDAGASTGGFTDVLLRRGAREVVCVDVGYGQLAWSLQTDDRVTVVDRTNVRDLTPATVGEPVDLVVADLSFISLRLVLPALVSVRGPDADLVLMVKPQFEVGRERLGTGGVVREPELRAAAVAAVAGDGVRGPRARVWPA